MRDLWIGKKHNKNGLTYALYVRPFFSLKFRKQTNRHNCRKQANPWQCKNAVSTKNGMWISNNGKNFDTTHNCNNEKNRCKRFSPWCNVKLQKSL